MNGNSASGTLNIEVKWSFIEKASEELRIGKHDNKLIPVVSEIITIYI